MNAKPIIERIFTRRQYSLEEFTIDGACCKRKGIKCQLLLTIRYRKSLSKRKKGKPLMYITGIGGGGDSVFAGYTGSEKHLERSGGCGRYVIK